MHESSPLLRAKRASKSDGTSIGVEVDVSEEGSIDVETVDETSESTGLVADGALLN